MATIPTVCPDCEARVIASPIPVLMGNNRTIYGWCDGCNRHFHGTPNDYLQMDWEIPSQLVPRDVRIADAMIRQEVSSSDPEQQETL